MVVSSLYFSIAHGLTCSLDRSLFNRCSDQITPLSPRAVIVLHVLIAKQVFQSEPAMRTTFADTAVGDDFAVSIDTIPLIKLLQRVRRLKCAILICRL